MNNTTENFWNDERVKEYLRLILSVEGDAYWQQEINKFKASKQKPLEYEIVSYLENDGNVWTIEKVVSDKYRENFQNPTFWLTNKSSRSSFKINSIKRLSDNQSFYIDELTDGGRISSFEIKENDCLVLFEGGSRKSLLVDIQKAAPKPVPLYKSEDGIDMYKGMDEWIVDIDSWLVHKLKVSEIINTDWFKTNRSFYKPELAHQYVELNKPQYSLQEIREELERNCTIEIQERIIRKLQKSKQ